MIQASTSSIEVGGRAYTLARNERRHTGKYVAWANAQLPDSLAALRHLTKDLPAEIQAAVIKEAVAQSGRKRNISDAAVQDVLTTPEGIEYIATVLLRDAHPDVKQEEAEKIVSQFVAEHSHEELEARLVECTGKKD